MEGALRCGPLAALPAVFDHLGVLRGMCGKRRRPLEFEFPFRRWRGVAPAQWRARKRRRR